ncbi:hypothetical protein [Methanofollis ethanolicus]|uniref:hypothetical protein n=1 Tax=Methanofollis ethanolicus TaxID=488124 RepID=UPI00082EFCD2|nr:hypothetical protein [Methanofollis ethanolicus]
MVAAHFQTRDLEVALKAGDRDAVHAALHDLILYRAVDPLAPADLDVVAGVLDLGGRAATMALQVMYASAVRQGTLPAEREEAAGRVRAALGRSGDDRTAVRHALHLLAVLGGARAVVEQLAHDARRFDGERVRKEDYFSQAVASALGRHDSDLAALEATLSGQAAEDVRAIREYAQDPAAYEERVRLMQDDEVEVL